MARESEGCDLDVVGDDECCGNLWPLLFSSLCPGPTILLAQEQQGHRRSYHVVITRTGMGSVVNENLQVCHLFLKFHDPVFSTK